MGYAINFYELPSTFLNFVVSKRKKRISVYQSDVITSLKSVPRYTEKTSVYLLLYYIIWHGYVPSGRFKYVII